MDSVKDALASFLEALKDRVSNPLVGSFIVSWVIWNFRLVLVLVGDGDGGWHAKLKYIDQALMVDETDWVFHGLLIPLAFACFWIFVFPFVSRFILVFDRVQRFATKRAVLIAEEKSPLSDEDATRLRIRWNSSSDNWEKERKLYLQTIEELQDKTEKSGTKSSDGTSDPKVRTLERAVNGVANIGGDFQKPPSSIYEPSPSEDRLPSGLRHYVSLNPRENPKSYVLFKGQSIGWPWSIDVEEQTEIPASLVPVLKGAVLNEEALLVLYAVRDTERFSINQVTNLLELSRFSVQVAADELSALGMIHGPVTADQYMITSAGRMFLAWVLRKGFEFNVKNEPF